MQQPTLTPKHFAEFLQGGKAIVALTGAGISTAAGIPDFRGPKGLYVTRRYDPTKVFEIDSFQRQPQYFYEFSRDFVAIAKTIQPTFTHNFLARLEQDQRLACVVTQNIDLLHHQAGNKKIIELHGSYSSATCQACGQHFQNLSYGWWHRLMAESLTPPVAQCPDCCGVLKPDIVFFGEMVHQFAAAEELVAECDLLLVLGSSLQVSPASHLPYLTTAPTIVVSQGEVMLPAAEQRFFVNADLDRYFMDVAKYLPEVTDC